MTHFLPDYLSRLDGHASGDAEFEPTVGCELLVTNTALEELDFSTFMVEQGKDQECSEIIQFLRNDELPTDETKARTVLAKSDTMAIVTPGVLCKFAEKKNRRYRVRGALSPRIMVPEAMRGKIMKDSTAATAAKVFLHEIVCRYGRVERLHTDRGATFLSDLFREFTTRVACKQTFTTGRMPTGNARVERMHKTLENIIGCYISEDHRVWPDLVPIALWTLRSTISGRTGFAPYTLLFGTDPVGMGFPEYSNAPDSLKDRQQSSRCGSRFMEFLKNYDSYNVM